MNGQFLYRAFGLNIASPVDFPGVPPGEGEPDVSIRFGQIPEGSHRNTADQAFASIRNIGAFLIRNGREITVAPADTADPAILRTLLMGRMMAFLFAQRGWISLHASAVLVDAEAVLFAASSGTGKSTMAAACYAHGWPVLTDDVAPLRVQDGICHLTPAWPHLRLLDDSVHLIRNARGYVSADDKQCVTLPRGETREVVRARAIYILDTGEKIASELLTPVQAVAELSAQTTYSRRPVPREVVERHIRACAQIAGTVPVRRLRRPKSLAYLPEVVELIRRELVL